MPRTTAFVALIQLLAAVHLAQPLGAQREDSLPVAVGARIRVVMVPSTPPPGWMIGRFASSDGVTLRMSLPPDESVFPVPWAEIVSLDVSRSQRTGAEAFMHGAKYGAAIFGAVSLVGIGAAAIYDESGKCSDCMIPATAFAVPAGVLLTLGGSFVGGLIGSGFRDRWERVR